MGIDGMLKQTRKDLHRSDGGGGQRGGAEASE